MKEKKIYKVIVVGGGASGLVSTIELLSGKDALSSSEVLLLERNDRVGKKLLATGNGQGNLTNSVLNESKYHGDKLFIKRFIENFEFVRLEEYFNSLGIFLTEDKDGKKYPLSKQASAVLDVFRANLESKGANIITNVKIEKITEEKGVFKVCSKDSEFFSRSVILACGGKAGKQFGTDGTAYSLATAFNHKLTPLVPSLVQLKTETDKIKGLKGLKEKVHLTAFDEDKELFSSVGDLLFTDFGISGNTVFSLSPYLVTAKKPSVKIEFLPELNEEELKNTIIKVLDKKYFSNIGLLCGIINKRVGDAVLKTVKEKTPENITRALKDFRLKVTGSLGFDYAQVTKGGIKTEGIDAKTYQSKLKDGLYIVGEMLDIDGDCGGYNLSFCFTSGILSAKSVKARFN